MKQIFNILHSNFVNTKSAQGRNQGGNLVGTSVVVGTICPPGGNRVKVSENLGATGVVPVTPADTSLQLM